MDAFFTLLNALNNESRTCRLPAYCRHVCRVCVVDAGAGKVHTILNMEYNINKYLIMCANCAHPSGEMKWFLLEDEDDNTVEFDSYDEAKEWCKSNQNNLLAYTILATSDFTYI